MVWLLLMAAGIQAPAPAVPMFVVSTPTGDLAPAPLEKMAEDWSIQVGGKSFQAGTEWAALRRERVPFPPYPHKNFALLTSGDRIRIEAGAAFRLEEEQILLRADGGAEFGVPLAFLSYLCWAVPEGMDEADRFLARLEKAKRPRDVLFLKNGDRIEGALKSPARGPVFTMQMGERSVSTTLEQIALLAVSTELQARPKARKTFAQVITLDGARLNFATLRLAEQGRALAGKTLFGANLEVPLEHVAALSLRHGLTDYLSDLVPKRYEHTPFLGVKWPLVADAAVTGRQLRVGGDFYDKGLGMHTHSQVTYSLDGKYRSFEARLGLDAGMGKPGSAIVSVHVDGTCVLGRTELAQGKPPVTVRIDVSRARALTLLAEFGNFGDVHGHVNWADARLNR
jgi:hypothetical protein